MPLTLRFEKISADDDARVRALLPDILAEFPLCREKIAAIYFIPRWPAHGRFVGKSDEGYSLEIGLAFGQAGVPFIPLDGQLRHELFHIEDKLTPAFGYPVDDDITDPSDGGGDGDKWNAVWDAWIEGRLERMRRRGVLERCGFGLIEFSKIFPEMGARHGFEAGSQFLMAHYTAITERNVMTWEEIIKIAGEITAAIPPKPS